MLFYYNNSDLCLLSRRYVSTLPKLVLPLYRILLYWVTKINSNIFQYLPQCFVNLKKKSLNLRNMLFLTFLEHWRKKKRILLWPFPWQKKLHLYFFDCFFQNVTSFRIFAMTSVDIFSILLSTHFLRCWQGEFVQQSWASWVSFHFPHSRNFHMWSRGDIVRRI